MSASISAGESGRSRSDRGAHTHTDQICLLPRLPCLFSGEVMHDAVPTLNLALGLCVCAARREHCFHSHPTFDFWSRLLRLTLDRRKPASDKGGNVSNYTGSACEGYACTSVFVRANLFFFGVGICRILLSQKKNEKASYRVRPVTRASDSI